jgi:hypothetical protein
MNAGQGCSNPRMGPVRSLPSTERVLFYYQDRGLTGPYVGMAPIADQLTKICYTSTNQWHPPNNVYDHSDDGINAHADKLWDAFQAGRNNNPQERILWWDWEENDSSTRHSINVPTSVQYDATRDTFHAAFYEVRIPPGYSTFQVTQEQADRLRAEAVRYSAAVAKRLCDRADSAGLTGYEQISYAHPDVPSTGVGWAAQYAQINPTWFCPYMLGGSIPCYFSGSIGEMNANIANPSYWTDTYAAQIKAQRAAFGSSFKIIPTIWAKWYRTEGGIDNANPANFPNGDPCVPSGFMTNVFNAILDAGADGAAIFQNSDQASSTGDLADRYSARHGELAAIVMARGDFVGIQY